MNKMGVILLITIVILLILITTYNEFRSSANEKAQNQVANKIFIREVILNTTDSIQSTSISGIANIKQEILGLHGSTGIEIFNNHGMYVAEDTMVVKPRSEITIADTLDLVNVKSINFELPLQIDIKLSFKNGKSKFISKTIDMKRESTLRDTISLKI